MARFFIDRPIFAWVIAIVVMLAGGLAITQLPVSMYPTIAPPVVQVNATYPGASAKVVEDSVTQIIEQNMTGLDGLMYMSATSDASGRASVDLTFETWVDPDIAQVQVQNKLQLAMPLLPQEVQRQGVRVAKSATGFLMVLGFVSSNDQLTRTDISDYVNSNLVDPLSRVPGVGNLQVFGSKYAMRIWLDPSKLDTYALTPADIAAAVQAQNQQVAVGQLGGAPAIEGQRLNATISAQDRLQTPEQFRDIIVRSSPDGSVLRLGDIARVELGAETYEFLSFYNREPAVGIAVSMATGANALDTAEAVNAKLAELKPFFPEGMEVVVPFDTTPFVKVSIESVVKTLFEAIALVFVVMYLFLQNFRATLIPSIAVPVVLLGTFGVLAATGFSINMLTMFAMVLAIGLLVDDAIVVVENVERLMSEERLSPLEATRKSMRQITGALVGIGLVLSAVFVPMAFMGGSTGIIYRQFSVTIVAAMTLSVLVALVLTPALCATLLQPAQHFSVQGFSFAGIGQNSAMAFVKLKDWSERTTDELSAGAVAQRAMGSLSQIKDALAFAFAPPAMPELGTSAGFVFFLKDNAGLGHDALVQARNQFLGAAAQSPLLVNVRPNGQDDTPQFALDIDTAKAAALGISIASINSTLSTAWGGQYIDDFVDRGRVKRVYMQADAQFRMVPEDFKRWSVRNNEGKMVPFTAFGSSHWDYGSPRLERYNGVPAMEMNGEGAPGVSSGDAMTEVERLVAQLPAGIGMDWTGLSFQERQAGAQTPLLYSLSLLIVFLCLAAMYESWTIPTSVLLVAPLGILGTVLGAWLMGMERDIYFQVAMLTTVGLTSKNAILIVEFAKENLERGMGLVEGTMGAVRDRLRPIVMTSLAFGLGVLPLAIASGAGSGAQNAIGIGVLGGMLVGTLLGLFFIPLFFVMVQKVFGGRKAARRARGQRSGDPSGASAQATGS